MYTTTPRVHCIYDGSDWAHKSVTLELTMVIICCLLLWNCCCMFVRFCLSRLPKIQREEEQPCQKCCVTAFQTTPVHWTKYTSTLWSCLPSRPIAIITWGRYVWQVKIHYVSVHYPVGYTCILPTRFLPLFSPSYLPPPSSPSSYISL